MKKNLNAQIDNTMKIFIAIGLLCAGIIAFLQPQVHAQEKSFTVSGEIKNLEPQTMRIVIKDKSAPRGSRTEEIQVKKDGSFSYSGKIEGIEVISFGSRKLGFNGPKFQFIGSPGADVHFTGAIRDGKIDAYPSGDQANDDLARLNKKLFPLMNKKSKIARRKRGKVKTSIKEVPSGFKSVTTYNSKEDSIQVQKINQAIEQINDKMLETKKQFVHDNPSSIVSAWLLSDMMVHIQISDERATNLFNRMDGNKLAGIPFYEEVAQRISGIKATEIGSPAPKVNTTNTYSGDRFDLASLRGKYVVIDFWGPWCMPCVKELPLLKEYREKYGDKLEIVGIGSESDQGERWRKFLDNHPEYDWPQIFSRSEQDYVLKFNVQGFPTNIIIDPEGNIVGRYVGFEGEHEGLYAKLDELLEE